MIFSLFVARRYLFGKKSKNIINYISAISVAVVAIVTMALFVALSVFNGLTGLVSSMFGAFDPDIKITPVHGKVFAPTSSFNQLGNIAGVASYSQVLEEDVLFRYADKQYIGKLKGVDLQYNKTIGIDTLVSQGESRLTDTTNYYAVVGMGVAYYLGIGTLLDQTMLAYVPRRNASPSASPDQAYRSVMLIPSGLFAVQQDIDSKYVLMPLNLSRQMLDYTNEVSAIEVKLKQNTDKDRVKQAIKALVGNQFKVQDSYEQHEFLYKIMKSEKWGIFLIVSFILLIASFNVIGSLTMLIIDKQRDIHILQCMGASRKTIKQVFLFEGWMISLLGAVIGLGLGILLCWLQSTFGLLKLQGEGYFVVDSYPVAINWFDAIWVFLMVTAIGYLAAWYPVRQITFQDLDKA